MKARAVAHLPSPRGVAISRHRTAPTGWAPATVKGLVMSEIGVVHARRCPPGGYRRMEMAVDSVAVAARRDPRHDQPERL